MCFCEKRKTYSLQHKVSSVSLNVLSEFVLVSDLSLGGWEKGKIRSRSLVTVFVTRNFK